MTSVSDTYRRPSSEYVTARPNRVGILYGSRLSSTLPDSGRFLERILSSLGISVFPATLFRNQSLRALEELRYDVIGLIGSPKDFLFLSSMRKLNWQVILAFAPKSRFDIAKSYLKISDAVVLGEASNSEWLPEIARVMYHFFESLVLPSLLNIDIADVKNIAKGIGLAFNEADDSAANIISRLPRACLVARSALLHFSCNDQVKLSEIYSISKAIALKHDAGAEGHELQAHKDVAKLVRRVNVKMGIRIRRTSDTKSRDGLLSVTGSKRISMTALLFGI